MAEWPGGARGALSLSFDNLGEAAEIELGALPPDDPSLGEHPTATRVLPTLLDALGEREVAATFFVEGINAQLYPDALQTIAASGHEVAYHAWRHEQWDELDTAAQAENLGRGITAFEELGLTLTGMRPPGGQLGPGGAEILRQAGLRYCSPAGEGAGIEAGLALLPFQWRHVDASCLLPPLAPVRELMAGSPDPLDAGSFLGYLIGEIDRLASEGGFLAIVLHLSLLDWLGDDRLGELLDRLSRAGESDDLWLAPCAGVAGHVIAHPSGFLGKTRLDPVSWAG